MKKRVLVKSIICWFQPQLIKGIILQRTVDKNPWPGGTWSCLLDCLQAIQKTNLKWIEQISPFHVCIQYRNTIQSTNLNRPMIGG